ncbi:MAG: autotransporter outer membrane beta-barrel domain-containing protein, partial [Phycisphaerales bacterium]|nr:autotransporter outer membrane beta-barrel domain-containing protein [Phycisphaerales bacterium]
VYAGITVFTHTGNDYSAATIIHGGTLAAGNPNVLSPNSDHTILPDGTLDLRGHNQTIHKLTNFGLIKTGGSGAAQAGYVTLTITGEYVGEDGTILFNTRLGDDTSPTDHVLVDGGIVTGHTFLQINNTGGLGAQTTGNGILLVGTTNGGSTAPDSFTLDGQVKAGAFAYTLHHGGVGEDAETDNWYLRSEGGTRIEVPPEVGVPSIVPRIGRAMIGTFFTRLGNYRSESDQLDATESEHANLFWARVFGETGKGGGGGGGGDFGFGKNGPEYSYNYGGTQIGSDFYRSETDTLGLYIGFSMLQSRVKDADGNHAGRVTMDALSLGGYWTHYSPTGWYTDMVLQGDWYTSIRSKASSGEEFSTRGLSLIASVEAGYVIELNKEEGDEEDGKRKGLSLIPQAQLIYQYTNIHDGTDSFSRIHYSATNQFYGRLGARLSRTLSSAGLTAWVEANVWHQFGNDAKTTFSALDGSNPTTISTRLGGTWAQALVGVSAPINKHVTLFATTDYNVGLSQSNHGFGGQIGIQIGW